MRVGAAAAFLSAAQALAQPTCLRPQWTECIAFPNGGRHVGYDFYNVRHEIAIPTNSEICVRNEWELQAELYSQFSRNGVPWPNPDWEVNAETFCLYKN